MDGLQRARSRGQSPYQGISLGRVRRIFQLVHWSRIGRAQRGEVDGLRAPKPRASASPPLRTTERFWNFVGFYMYVRELELGLRYPDPLVHSIRARGPFAHSFEFWTCDHCRRGIPVELSVCPFCGQVVR